MKSALNYTPDEFNRLYSAGNYDIIPLYREFPSDFDTPLSILKKICRDPYCFLLESITGGEHLARYSFLGYRPSEVFYFRGNELTEIKGKKIERKNVADPFAELGKIFSARKSPLIRDLPPFHGGGIGYIGYDMIRHIEKIPEHKNDTLGMPDACFLISESFIVFDHVFNNIKIIANVFYEKNHTAAQKYHTASALIDSIEKKIFRRRSIFPIFNFSKPAVFQPPDSADKEQFINAVKKAREYIKNGDIFQAVLSMRFTIKSSLSAFSLYRSLRMINPSPYMFFLRFGEIYLVGSSPEILVKKDHDLAEVRPIAGTRKRGYSEEEDKSLEQELLADKKELAEHVMLVDLGRNDLGRVCEYGSVAVHDRMVIERYAHVMHIVSSVRGKVQKGTDAASVFKAAFPAGTVSGAPKVRAMEIINELEPVKRGAYGGAVAYFSWNGNMDSCIVIRTIIKSAGHIQELFTTAFRKKNMKKS